ncbi:hypothetical protein ACFL27_10880 [candidate division CSSED10-310 bacterium]|uniref:Uncharacterized protein n=1 Tax=candidate division CSSED10-310 bacterium TaxID=2855610 RepID=A0ABV6YWV0_UNCC1
MPPELFKIISTADQSIELVLTKTKVMMRLSEAQLKEISNEIDDEKRDSEAGFLGKVQSFILSNVEKLVQKSIEYNLDEINNLRYEEGKLVFDYQNKNLFSFENVKVNDQNALGSFSESDSHEFIEKFKVAQEEYQKFLEG